MRILEGPETPEQSSLPLAKERKSTVGVFMPKVNIFTYIHLFTYTLSHYQTFVPECDTERFSENNAERKRPNKAWLNVSFPEGQV